MAIPAPEWASPLVDDIALLADSLPADWEKRGHPFSRRVLAKALWLLDDLASDRTALLVNSDLHYENVLAGQREPWLVIDPKVVRGALEYGVAQLMWQSFAAIRTKHDFEQRLATVVRAANLNAELARSWTYVRVVECWLWGLQVGLTEDPARCEQLIEWL